VSPPAANPREATAGWLAAWPASAPGTFPPPGAEGIALRLVLLVHLGVDWDVWGPRRVRYWTALAERVRGATYRSRTLQDWWEQCASRLASTPRTADERAELAQLLRGGNDSEVLAVLYRNARTLVLYCQVLADHRRAGRQATGVVAS
jgi:hypothetical protein